MIQLLAKNWWALELRGALTIVFGLFALFLPNITLGALILIFGIYALAEGIVLLTMSLKRRTVQHWWITMLQGLAGIGAGIAAFVWPAITAVVLLFIIALWALITGVLEIVGAIRLRKEVRGEWLLILSGVLSLVFAFILFANPAAGALAMIWVIGVYAVVFGILLMLLGVRMHKTVSV